MPEFRRLRLPHDVPGWIDPTQEAYFLTINTRPRGTNQLAIPDTWTQLIRSVEFRESRSEWKWSILLAMPDHLHGIVYFPQSFRIRNSISAWKRWLATQHGVIWQDGFFEHRLRSQEHATEKADYIRLNPVRAGLCTSPHEWPYVRDWKNS